jgi:tRNA A37 threonylcarbamoyladenosine dehydratase
MFMITEEAWVDAIDTLKRYANGKVVCKRVQREAFECLHRIRQLEPRAVDTQEMKKTLGNIVLKEIREAENGKTEKDC